MDDFRATAGLQSLIRARTDILAIIDRRTAGENVPLEEEVVAYSNWSFWASREAKAASTELNTRIERYALSKHPIGAQLQESPKVG